MPNHELKWDTLLKALRVDGGTTPPESPREIRGDRSPFAADIDRLIFSDSFRRLSRKSQVHPLAMNDHLHNRLSHSLEVSCVGRSLGCKIGFHLQEQGELPPGMVPSHIGEIVQAACLAHDIGNPPFGHAGEEAIREWFLNTANSCYLERLASDEKSDFTCFDGNAQGFRVVTNLEMTGIGHGGLQLTYPVVASMVKYPISSYRADVFTRYKGRKYNYHKSEKEIFIHIFHELGLSISSKKNIRHPLSYLMEVADDICYSIIDLEDALELRLITIDDFISIYNRLERVQEIEKEPASPRNKASHIRAVVISLFIDMAFELFIEYYNEIMRGELHNGLADNSPQLQQYIQNAKKLASQHIYPEKRKIALEVGSYTVYQTLLDAFIPAVYKTISEKEYYIPYKHRKALELINKDFSNCNLYDGYLHVIDYITGMTDSYATFLAQQFLGAGTGPWQV